MAIVMRIPIAAVIIGANGYCWPEFIYMKYVATEKAKGHPPTWEDKLVHFVVNGGPQDFHRSFMEAHPGAIFLESR